MKEIKAYIIFLIAIFMIFFLFVCYYNGNETVKCISTQELYNERDEIKITLNSNVTFFIKNNKLLMAKIIGSVKSPEGDFHVNRTLHFSHSFTNKNDGEIMLTKIYKEDIFIKDDTPNDLLYSNFYPAKPGVDFYVVIKKLNNDLLEIRGPINPLFICKVQG